MNTQTQHTVRIVGFAGLLAALVTWWCQRFAARRGFLVRTLFALFIFIVAFCSFGGLLRFIQLGEMPAHGIELLLVFRVQPGVLAELHTGVHECRGVLAAQVAGLHTRLHPVVRLHQFQATPTDEQVDSERQAERECGDKCKKRLLLACPVSDTEEGCADGREQQYQESPDSVFPECAVTEP